MKRILKIVVVVCLLGCFAFLISSFTAFSVGVAPNGKTEFMQQRICPECGITAQNKGLYCDECGALVNYAKLVVGLAVSAIGFVLIPLMILLIMTIKEHRQTIKQIEENITETSELIKVLEEKLHENK